MERHVLALKTLGHPERLRILALLSRGELTVSELVQILQLSQPRVTQYIISLESAGVIERLKEGSWVFSRIEYLPQADIESKMRELLGEGPFDYMVDLGTGTGRMLELFSDRIKRGSGIDNNAQMLKVARHKLAALNLSHITVRQGDLLAAPLESDVAEVVSLHQVLHYLDEPQEAIIEAARLLGPGGTLLIVDYESHDLEDFRLSPRLCLRHLWGWRVNTKADL